MGESKLAFIKNCLARKIVIKKIKFVNIFLKSLRSGGIVHERSGFIKPFDVFQ